MRPFMAGQCTRIASRRASPRVAIAEPWYKVAGVLRSLETYVSGQSGLIIRLCHRPAKRRADIDGDHREHGAAAAAPADEPQPTDALVAERSASDAQGPHRGRQRDLQQGSHDR